MDKNYKIKRIYSFLVGIKESLSVNQRYTPLKVGEQYNSLIEELEVLLEDNLSSYKVDETELYDKESYFSSYILFQLNPILSYLEKLHINSSEYQITKVGYLYNSIEDKELRDRCGDILLGDTAFDRAINQATQVLENRIKIKANLDDSPLIGINLVSKVIHPKLESTILKFSDNPDVQEGYSFIFKGIISVYRNPTHHSLAFKCNREFALKFCSYVDELLKAVDTSEIINI